MIDRYALREMKEAKKNTKNLEFELDLSILYASSLYFFKYASQYFSETCMPRPDFILFYFNSLAEKGVKKDPSILKPQIIELQRQ